MVVGLFLVCTVWEFSVSKVSVRSAVRVLVVLLVDVGADMFVVIGSGFCTSVYSVCCTESYL